MKKECLRCKNEKNIDEFSFKSKKDNKRQAYCKECFVILRKESYEKNKKHYLSKAKNRKGEVVEWVFEMKKNMGCERCGFSHPVALDFHHINNDKEYDVSKLVRNGNKDKILKEIEKCIVLCSNCHRIFHYEELNSGEA